MRYVKQYAMALIGLAIFSSCAAWRADDTPPMGKLSNSIFKGSKPINISLSLNLYEVFEEDLLLADESSQIMQDKLLDQIKKAYGDNNIFNLVDKDSPSRELSVEVSVTKKKEASLFRTLLTLATLYLIPKRTNEELTITTKFIDNKGMLVGMVEKKETVVVWHQLFMIFAFPFTIPGSIKDETFLDLNRATIFDAFSDGFFIDLNH